VLVELHVRDLGVIEEVRLELGPGMTVLTGETGAGKTLIVEGLELLLGGRADALLVRPGADEALVEGRFLSGHAGPERNGDVDGEERILARAVPASGRSRAWLDGRMAQVSALAEAGRHLVDLHGQHAHQSLLDGVAQRRALDLFGDVDTRRLEELLAERRRLRSELDALGGDARARARQVDLLRHQLAEIEAARLHDLDEEANLAEEEERLAGAAAAREAAGAGLAALRGGDEGSGATDRLGEAADRLSGLPALARLAARLEALQAEAADVATDLREVLEAWEDDPERLAEVRSRRQLLRDLARKYGEGVAGVVAYAERARDELAALETAEETAARRSAELEALEAGIAGEGAVVGKARRGAAGKLAKATQERLRLLAMARARVEVLVGDTDPGDDVTFLLGANPGEPALPLGKVASGGELARAMLALRLVLSEAPPTMVFDEVDAGVGGEAAVAVGRALAELARGRQVLAVTHLAQVAAFADHQLVVRKEEVRGRTVASVAAVRGGDRVVELARMLSGRPDSATAHRHAEELLAAAGDATLHR
jgi:DNA repair protein RecN (Recombination protein N)